MRAQPEGQRAPSSTLKRGRARVRTSPPLTDQRGETRVRTSRPLTDQRGEARVRTSRPCIRAQPGGRKRECTSERSQDGAANARRFDPGSPERPSQERPAVRPGLPRAAPARTRGGSARAPPSGPHPRLSKCTSTKARSAGVTPLTRPACPSVRGCTAASFSRASVRRCLTLL
jgi:hypothetical protein